MIKRFLSWLRRPEDDNRRLVHDMRAQIAEMESKLSEVKAKEDEKANVYTSTEPWVEICSDGVNDVKGMYVKLDWNDAFIEYLKDRGIKAADDEAMVQKWLAMLYQDLMARMETDAINRSTPTTFE